jgi:NitT/TauT family transport system permease protein
LKILLGILIFLIAWQVFSVVLNVPLILPSPYLTFESLSHLAVQLDTYQAILSTVWKSLLVLLTVIAVGIPIGFFMGISESVYEIFRPAVRLFRLCPSYRGLRL